VKPLQIAGQRFGRLTAVAPLHPSPQGYVWRFVCDCGGTLDKVAKQVKWGNTQSCGCYAKDVHSARCARLNLRHGLTYSPTWVTWQAMKQRCTDPNAINYRYYGERGVSICERWAIFENFLADMGERPKGKTLDRIDPFGNYEPSNCRWATVLEQRHNRTDSPAHRKTMRALIERGILIVKG